MKQAFDQAQNVPMFDLMPPWTPSKQSTNAIFKGISNPNYWTGTWDADNKQFVSTTSRSTSSLCSADLEPKRAGRFAVMADTTDELARERRGAVSIVRLNRPEARNALTPGLLAAIGAAIVEAETDPDIRALVITGTGDRAFCAGMDLRAFSRGEAMGTGDDEASAAYHRLTRGEVSVPLVGAANATAVAGGFELLLGCDVIVASSKAQFGLPEVKRGLFPAGGGTAIGTRIPLSIALEMTMTGDSIERGTQRTSWVW